MWSKVKIFGHPIHPMLIAYPVALYTATLVGFAIFAATSDLFWLRFTIAVNVAGVVMAAIAAIPGFIDWAFGIPRETEAKSTGWKHMLFNVFSLALFTTAAIVYAGKWDGPASTSPTLGLILSGIGVLSTITAGFYGWMLVQTHHVGVDMTDKQAELDREKERRLQRAS